MKSFPQMLSALFLATTVATSILTVSSTAAANPGNSIKVDRLVFPVTLADGNTYNVVGYLYYKGSYNHRTLQVLVHGASYTHKYWDIPSFNGQDYSYARYMADEKYAVLALDSIGTGESSRPDGDFTDLTQTVDSMHQILNDVRTEGGTIDEPFTRVALVGHSFGSLVNSLVQSTYGDADALVNTGFVFTPHAVPVDPAVVGPLLGAPYILLPGWLRATYFYNAATADPAVINYDNTNISDTITRGQFLGMLNLSGDPTPVGLDEIDVPVLTQFGELDVMQPASFAAADAALYTSAPSVTTAIIPSCGHILNGHFTAPVGWAQIDNWLQNELPK